MDPCRRTHKSRHDLRDDKSTDRQCDALKRCLSLDRPISASRMPGPALLGAARPGPPPHPPIASDDRCWPRAMAVTRGRPSSADVAAVGDRVYLVAALDVAQLAVRHQINVRLSTLTPSVLRQVTVSKASGGSRKKYLGGLAPHHLGGNHG